MAGSEVETGALIRSGLPSLDLVLQGLRPGDNVVWQVEKLEDYAWFVTPFVKTALADKRTCVYFRFAPHPALLAPQDGLTIAEVDPGQGFDVFSLETNRVIEKYGRKTCYVFDNLSTLVTQWATDELLANFFQVTCPYLFELETVAYFGLTRGKHSHATVARIRDTTQLLLDVYHVQEKMYIHPVKVWDRYSPQMFLPHVVTGDQILPVFESGDAAAVSVTAHQSPLLKSAGTIAPWESVYQKLERYQEPGRSLDETNPEFIMLKQELTRMMFGQDPEFNDLADSYLTLDDLLSVRSRLVGSGRIGGKAAGMILARRILLKENLPDLDFSRVLEAHDSFYIGSDVFYTFLVDNNLFRLRLKLTRGGRITPAEFEEVKEHFLTGKFSPVVLEQFRNILDYYGEAPIIVRSSSLLEDSFGNAFAGKYYSEFCTNQGDPEKRLRAFLTAVKLVYASALNPSALSYRKNRGLAESEEQMAILVQRVSGLPYRNYFFPTLAGVAYSRNLYTWTDKIDPKQGIIRLVFGLGTRAVERVEHDYPRMIAVSHPELRPEVGLKVARYSQRQVDLLDLKKNSFLTVPFSEVVSDAGYPNLHLFVSVAADTSVSDPATSYIKEPVDRLVLTFNNLLRKTNLVRILALMLSTLEKAYGQPVDIEFTAFVSAEGQVKVNLLQCRPLVIPGFDGSLSVPSDVPGDRVLFRSDRMIYGGHIRRIRYIVYVDPACYAEKPLEIKSGISRLVGRINQVLSDSKFLLMGPGRWGSSNIDLGVPVSYGDIDNASVLVEIAREESGHLPELSYGTHFFQDLVESRIVFLPVYPEDSDTQFHTGFFAGAPNILDRLVPDCGRFLDVIKVIDVPAASQGRYASVIADPGKQSAICFLE